MSKVSLLASGDAILTHAITAENDDDFQDLVKIIRETEVSITNVEMTYPGRDRHPSTTMQGIPMAADPALLPEFGVLGFNLFAMGNNHATDYGTDGLVATMEAMEANGYTYAGVGRTLVEARSPAYLEAPQARVALISAGSSNARLAVAADIGIGDGGRAGIAPLRIQKTHYVNKERFADLQAIMQETGVDIASAGTTAPGIHFPYPDRNVYDGPPEGGFAVESVHFVPSDNPRVQTDVLERDIEALLESVSVARRMSDIVVVALHCHEGLQGRWNTDTPAEFLPPLAHRLIDAGAHAVVGSGPHQLRGVELYKGRPICYSLGNFIFNIEKMATLPPETYEQQGMPLTSTTADLYDRVDGYQKRDVFWEAVVPRFEFVDGELVSSELHPITMGQNMPRSRRGTPRLTSVEEGTRILNRLDGLSRPFGTSVEVIERDGRCFGRITALE